MASFCTLNVPNCNSIERTAPDPFNAELIMFIPCAKFTFPKVSTIVVLSRPVAVIKPPRIVIGAASFTRFDDAANPVLSSVSVA